MTNAVWQSPPLPRTKNTDQGRVDGPMGSGHKFKADLLGYFKAYNTKRDVCKSLATELAKYDFSTVRAAFIASVPGRHPVGSGLNITRWGWNAMKHALHAVPVRGGKSKIVVQVSSIATLGSTNSWLEHVLFDSLSSSAPLSSSSSRGSGDGTKPDDSHPRPSFRVVFPTPDEIRSSLDGYASGGSIHTKIQSAQQIKQLQYLRPLLCHWANDSPSPILSVRTGDNNGSGTSGSSNASSRDGGRARAAPHIKTYVRYNAELTLDWALLTSANLSKQAWGENVRPATEDIRIASWEVGVLVWPELVANEKGAKMVAAFKTDMPSPDDDDGVLRTGEYGIGRAQTGAELRSNGGDELTPSLVGLRIPYNLPLKRYGPHEEPWVATAEYREPDWMGRNWAGC